MRTSGPDPEHLTRRRLVLRTLGLAGGALALGRAAPAPAAAATSDADRARLMARAVELRRIAVERGDQAFGAVVARDGRIVGEGTLGPWRGSFAWKKTSTRIRVPPQAREAILRIGLLGATGEVSVDEVSLTVTKRQ